MRFIGRLSSKFLRVLPFFLVILSFYFYYTSRFQGAWTVYDGAGANSLSTKRVTPGADDDVWRREPEICLCPNLPAAARLGNMMFAYGSLMGLALKFNGTVLLKEEHRDQLVKIFDLKFLVADSSSKCQCVSDQSIFERWGSRYDERVVELLKYRIASRSRNLTTPLWMNSEGSLMTFRPTRAKEVSLTAGHGKLPSYTVSQYLQSWRYFNNFSASIKSEFRIHGWISRRVKRIMNNVSTDIFCSKSTSLRSRQPCPELKDVIWVGIHIRRSDLMQESAVRRGYTMATRSYLDKAIKLMSNKFNSSKLLFLVSSDDMAWSKDNVKSVSPVLYTSDLRAWPVAVEDSQTSHDEAFEESVKMKLFGQIFMEAIFDFAFLAHCRHVIMTVGSFGWWAGYLSGGTVTYYKDYPRPQSTIGYGFLSSDYYLPEWIGLS